MTNFTFLLCCLRNPQLDRGEPRDSPLLSFPLGHLQMVAEEDAKAVLDQVDLECWDTVHPDIELRIVAVAVPTGFEREGRAAAALRVLVRWDEEDPILLAAAILVQEVAAVVAAADQNLEGIVGRQIVRGVDPVSGAIGLLLQSQERRMHFGRIL